ncbi:MAG: dUTP diphosphatase [Candidatus Humimicrobiaceae bacterium]|jgi:dUTP pyrophosphatase|nr:dUTP diphosphatase [Actinomycetota bacterium]MDD5600626.1 dUTP diphosphatase [Actinomycetota bacterium]MDY0027784.1 dUTP diphosphatase [Candidatus Humimicrobiaceae bacterium]
MVTLKIKLLDKTIPMPAYAHSGDAGLDLYSAIDCELKPFERKKIPTGIKVSIPEGYAGFLQPRSGLAFKNGIGIVNSPGLIDSGYRGEVCVILINYDPVSTFNIKKGDKICQMVIKKIENVSLEVVEELDETDRGEGGFGSSDK